MQHQYNSTAFTTHLYIRANCQNPVKPKKKLTANRFMFFGMMTIEYLAHIHPTRSEATHTKRYHQLHHSLLRITYTQDSRGALSSFIKLRLHCSTPRTKYAIVTNNLDVRTWIFPVEYDVELWQNDSSCLLHIGQWVWQLKKGESCYIYANVTLKQRGGECKAGPLYAF